MLLDLTPDVLQNQAQGLTEMIGGTAQLFSQLLFAENKHKVALYLLTSSQIGDPTEPEHLETVIEPSPAKLSHLRKAKLLYQSILESFHMMCGGKRSKTLSKMITEALLLADQGPDNDPKEQKRIIIFTSSNPVFSDSQPEILDFNDQLKSLKCNVDLYLLGANSATNIPENLQPFFAKTGPRNEGGIRAYKYADFEVYLRNQRHRLSKSTSKFKGNFELSPINFIAVLIQRHTAKETPMQFSKHVCSSKKGEEFQFNPVRQQSSYVHPEDPHLQPLEETRIFRSFRYGQQLIQSTPELAEGIKGDNEKCLKLLAFVNQASIPRTAVMGCVDCVTACPESAKDTRAFNALTEAMICGNKAALVRFVARKNDSPKLGALFPKKVTQESGEGVAHVLYLAELPTIEDIREYNFGSSIKSSATQQATAEDLIQAMLISNLPVHEQEDLGLARPTLSRNPYLDLVEDRLVEVGLMGPGEAVDANRNDIPAIRRAHPERATRKRVKEVSERVGRDFALRENEVREEEQPRVFWSELLANRESEEQRVAQKGGLDKDDRVTRDLSKATPKEDFRDMLRNKKEDLVMRAVTQMQGLILELIRATGEGGNFARPMDYLVVLREGCVAEDEPDAFNDFLRELRDEVSREPGLEGLLGALQEREFSLISRRESHRSAVSEEAARRFMQESRPMPRQRAESFKGQPKSKDWMNMIE